MGFPLKKQRYEIADFQRPSPFKFAKRNYIFYKKLKYTLTIFWKSILFTFLSKKLNENSTLQYCCVELDKSVKVFEQKSLSEIF